MVRISDILRRGRDDEDPKEKKREAPKETPKKIDDVRPAKTPQETIEKAEKKKEEVLKAKPKDIEKKEEKPLPTHIEIARVVMEKTKAGRPKAEEVYNELIGLIKSIMARGEKLEAIQGKEVLLSVDRAIDQVALASDDIMLFANNYTEENYLYAHSANVCLLSIKLGLGLGFNKSRLSDLGVSAFLHDVGMVKFVDLAHKARKLTREEFEAIKLHPAFGVEILTRVSDLSKVAIYVTHQHHERMDGKGYPQGFTASDINEYARIISIVDVFEGMTHPRPHRKRMLPYVAVQEILKMKGQFDMRVIKALIEEVGIYPVGSWVELNTGEVAKVTRVSRGFPLQPTVDVVADPTGRRLNENRPLELTRQAAVYIKRPLDDAELSARAL